MPRMAAMRSTIAARWGAILGRSQMTVTSTAATVAASRTHEIGGVAQELVGRGAAPARVARREMHANVAGADRAEHRVGQPRAARHRHRNVRQGSAVRDPNSAYPEMIAWGEGVHVEALADADISLPSGEEALGRGKVLRSRNLQIVFRCRRRSAATAPLPRRLRRRRSARGRSRRGGRRGSHRSESPAGSERATGRNGRSSPQIISPSARLIVSRKGRQGIAATRLVQTIEDPVGRAVYRETVSPHRESVRAVGNRRPMLRGRSRTESWRVGPPVTGGITAKPATCYRTWLCPRA